MERNQGEVMIFRHTKEKGMLAFVNQQGPIFLLALIMITIYLCIYLRGLNHPSNFVLLQDVEPTFPHIQQPNQTQGPLDFIPL